jgi:dipeptidyl aminopeptidase/acylaminoacyl peptidase
VTTAIDRGLWGAHWMPGGQALLVAGNDDAQKSLWVQPLNGAPEKLDLGGLNATGTFGPPDLDIAANGAIALIASGSQRPPELYWMDSVTSPPRALTDYNAAIASMNLGRSEEIRWQTHDGMQANGILIYPPDFNPDKRYPLVLKIHGGPMSATTLSFDGFGQVLAARDMLVFGPNYRGSDNLGNAFQSAIIHDAGAGPGQDVMAGLAAVQALGIVDDARIGVSGWSYGGYMTSWLIGNYPDTWRAAMAGAPVTDYVDQYALSDMNVSFGWGFDSPPWSPEAQAAWREQSPIAHVHRASTPTLILCNTGDLRVPITESYKLFHALRDHDVPVQFVGYPLPGHFPGDPVHRRDVFRRWADWMEQRFELPRDAPVEVHETH